MRCLWSRYCSGQSKAGSERRQQSSGHGLDRLYHIGATAHAPLVGVPFVAEERSFLELLWECDVFARCVDRHTRRRACEREIWQVQGLEELEDLAMGS